MKSLRDFKNSEDRRSFLEEELNMDLGDISVMNFSEDQVLGRNIENLIGSTQIPLGIVGPLRVQNLNSKDYYIPLATTEGALLASISRGCKVINLSGGAKAFSEYIGMTRGPVFETEGVEQSLKLKNWVLGNVEPLGKIAEGVSSHIKLLNCDFSITGKNVFIRFYFDCDQAMGMNMATFATSAMVEYIEKQNLGKCISVAGNFDIDKKAGWLNFINGRGQKAWAEVVLKKEIVRDVLKVETRELERLIYKKCLVGTAMSGGMGFNCHFANIIAAIFIATGQDLAHVVEGSLGMVNAELQQNGDLYFSVYLPSLLVGLVGGGTSLPSQNLGLKILGVKTVNEFAEVVAGAVLAGEISLSASLTEGSLTRAHKRLGRRNSG